MLALKFLFMFIGLGLFSAAVIVVAYDVYMAARLRWLLQQASADSAASRKGWIRRALSGRYAGGSPGSWQSRGSYRCS